MHDPHESLDGYHPQQLLHDGCAECEERSQSVAAAISKLDPDNFERAWKRAGELQLIGISNVSNAELPMLRALAAVEVQLERRGMMIGMLP